MDLEQKSIERIKMASEMSLHHYGKPLICTYSGGKDSDVMLELFKRSGVPFEVQQWTHRRPYTTSGKFSESLSFLESRAALTTIDSQTGIFLRCGILSHKNSCRLRASRDIAVRN